MMIEMYDDLEGVSSVWKKIKNSAKFGFQPFIIRGVSQGRLAKNSLLT